MCGITAIVNLAGRFSNANAKNAATNGVVGDPESKKRKLTNGVSSRIDHRLTGVEDQLDSSLDAINHRGPDSHGSWVSHDGNVGMSLTEKGIGCVYVDRICRSW